MITLDYLSIRQKGITFYLSSADARQIINSVNVNRRVSNASTEQFDLLHLEEKIEEIQQIKVRQGLQRELIRGKISEISKYLSNEFGLIPNSIILNIHDPLSLVEFGTKLVIPEDPSIIISALDGQHRIEGLKLYLELNPSEIYDVPLTIFHNAELEFQAYLFSIINSTQTKINKSFLYDLLALSTKQIDEFRLSHEIASWLNTSEDSILKGSIKMLGKGPGWLSQAAFIDYLIPNLLISEKRTNNNVVFKSYLLQKQYNKIADFVNDYFRAIKEVFNQEFDSNQYIFKTAFIFGLFMRLLPYAFIYSVDNSKRQYDFNKLIDFISAVKSERIDFTRGGIYSGTGSSGKQKQLFDQIMSGIQGRLRLRELVERFQSTN